MKTLTTFILAGALALLAQPNQLDLRQDPPTAVQSERVSSAYTGTSGATTYYYWVVTRYPIGFIVPTSPVVVGGASALGGGNSVALAWPAMTGASSYDVLRTTTNAAPSSCTCAVVLATTGTTLTDNGAALSAWPPGGLNSAGVAQAELQINNRDAGAPYITLAVRNAQRILNYQLGILKNGSAPSYVPSGFIQPYANAQGALACVDSTGVDCMATRPGPTNYCADVSVTDAYACSLAPAITAYEVGNSYRFIANTPNTGPATIDFNSIGAVAIKTASGADLADSDIRSGQMVDVVYTGLVMQMQSQPGNDCDFSVSGPANVLCYGADPTLVSNSAPAFNAAIAAAVYGGEVLVPRGAFLLSGLGSELILIDKPITLRCASWGGTQIYVDASVPNTTDVIRVHGSSSSGVVGLNIQNCQILPLSGTPARHGINLDATFASVNGDRVISRFTINRNYFGQFGGSGLKTTFPTGSDGVFLGTISENTFYGGLDLTNAGDGLVLRENTLLGTGPGVLVDLVSGATTINIESNRVTSCSGGVIIVHAENPNVQRNLFEPVPGCATGTNNAIIDVRGDVSRPVISPKIRDNQFTPLATGPLYNVRVDYATSAVIDSNNHYLSDLAQYCINLTAHGTKTTVLFGAMTGIGVSPTTANFLTGTAPGWQLNTQTGQMVLPIVAAPQVYLTGASGFLSAPYGSIVTDLSNGVVRLSNAAISAGVAFDVATDGIFKVKTRTGAAVGKTITKLPTDCTGIEAGVLYNNAGTPAFCP